MVKARHLQDLANLKARLASQAAEQAAQAAAQRAAEQHVDDGRLEFDEGFIVQDQRQAAENQHDDRLTGAARLQVIWL